MVQSTENIDTCGRCHGTLRIRTMPSRPIMTIDSVSDPGEAETVHVITYGSERFSVVFRSVDPVIEVRGLAIAWEAVMRMSNGREFLGYGGTRPAALHSAHESATSDGALTGVDLGLVMDALCPPHDGAPSFLN